MELANRFTAPGLLFLLTLVFGFWLSHAGKPYNGILFNVHKLIALGAVVLAVFQLTKLPNLLSPVSLTTVGLALAALSVIALFVSGALMSAGKLEYSLMLTIHRIAPVILVVGLGLAMIFLKSAP